MMKKEKFITVMAIFDEKTQKILQDIQDELIMQYGMDTKTQGIPFHITLGSYALEETDSVVANIINVAEQTKPFEVQFDGLRHFSNVVRFMKPVIGDKLQNLHRPFDSDYANGFDGWMPHVTVYRHNEPTEIQLSEDVVEMIEKLSSAKIVGIELGEFFPPKKIIRVMFNE